MSQRPNPARILAYDHIGIRVSEQSRALSFYQALGFEESARFTQHEANEMLSADGVRINLLLDAPVKLPGITHPAFVVDDLEALQAWLGEQGIRITQGPHAIGPRRVALFIRDPDGNVLEFNQLVDGGGK
jgi:lactoylglutathione lyase